MIRTISILVVILVAVGIGLSLLTSGDEYAAEKLFYHVMKINNKVLVNPDVAPPALVSSVENGLQKLLKRYPKSNVASRANLAFVEFYINNKRYDDALSLIDTIMNTYTQNVAMLSTAQFLKGFVYEKQNQWDRALSEFTILKERFPTTQIGLRIPLYIGRYYASKGREVEAENAYNDAARFYEKLETDNAGKILGYAASTLLIQAYLNLEDYEKAGKVLESTLDRYFSSRTLAPLLQYTELIFVEKLKNPQKAIEIYEYVKGKARNANLARLLQKKIEKLKSKK